VVVCSRDKNRVFVSLQRRYVPAETFIERHYNRLSIIDIDTRSSWSLTS
jgi:hypothetical protein